MRETTPDLTRISKYISLILRHKPEVIGIQLDAHGWADVNALLAGISAAGGSVVTINQSTPESGAAQVAVSVRTDTMQMSVEEMLQKLRRQRTVVEIRQGV